MNRKIKSIPPGFLAESETVFAMTIHKSQGSEYDQVLVMLPEKEMPLLTAELLYTGVTRAKTKVFIQSAENVLRTTAAKRVKRASGITRKIKRRKAPVTSMSLQLNISNSLYSLADQALR